MTTMKKCLASLAAVLALFTLLCLPALAAGDMEVTVGVGGQYQNVRAVFADQNLSGDVTVRLLSDVTDNVASGKDEEIMVVPERFTSLTVAPGDGFDESSPVIWVVKNQNSIDKYAALYLNGRDFTLEKGVRLGDLYDTNIFGGSYRGTVAANPVITIRGRVDLSVYGGGYNSALVGSPTIVVEGVVGNVYGGGLAAAHGTGNTDDERASVTGDVTLEIRTGAQATYVRGGGRARAYITDYSEGPLSTAVSNVEGKIRIVVDGSTDSIVGGGYLYQFPYEGYDVTANVKGNIEITLGGDSQSIGSRGIEVYGGGYAYDLKDQAEKAGTHRATANVEGNIKISAVEDNTASQGQPDSRTFRPLMGGGYGIGIGSTADVDGDTDVTTARVSFGSSFPIAGGGHADHGGHAVITGTTHVTVKSIEGQVSKYENGNMVFGGGMANDGSGELTSVADVGAAVVRIEKGALLQTGGFKNIVGGGFARGINEQNANRQANVLGDVLIEVDGASRINDIVVGGGMVSIAGTATVGGKVKVVLKDTVLNGFLYAGCFVTKGDASTASPVKSSKLTLLGSVTLPGVWISSGGIDGGLEVQVGDDVTETEVDVTDCLYEDEIKAVSIGKNAALRHTTSGANNLFYNLQNLTVAQGGRLELLQQESPIPGELSGEGTIALPAGKNIQVNGAMSGNLTLETSSGMPAKEDVLAWSVRANTSGRFRYNNTIPGTKFAAADTNGDTAEWCCWSLVDAYAVSASVDGGHGQVTPEEQLVGQGESATVTLTPEYGYKLKKLLRGGTDVTGDVSTPTDAARTTTYSFLPSGDETLQASFEPLAKDDMENRVEKLPEPTKVTPEDQETILDAKLDLESMPEEEKRQVDDTKLNEALEKLPDIEVRVEVVAQGNIDVENKHSLLSEMTGDEAKDLREGKTALYRLGVTVAPREELTPEEQAALNAAAGTLKTHDKFDVTVEKVIEPASGAPLTVPLTSLKNPLRVVFEVPQELRGGNRRFYMLRLHDGRGERLEDLDQNPETVTIESGLFSAYVLAYEETGQQGGDALCTVIARAGEGGKISPSGTVAVPFGGRQTFSIAPQEGWAVWDVLVDGTSVGAVESYTFENVRKSHTIEAVFQHASEVRPPWNPFEDVREGDWFYDSVKNVYEGGLMLGTSETRFQPGLTTSRAMVATILWRMSGAPGAVGKAAFEDVPEDAWYSQAVTWGVEKGVLKGYGDGSFRPDQEITREELAALLRRFRPEHPGNSQGGGNSVSSFRDAADISGWALEDVTWAVECGILTGRGDNTLDPRGKASRAEAAAMLTRYQKLS